MYFTPNDFITKRTLLSSIGALSASVVILSYFAYSANSVPTFPTKPIIKNLQLPLVFEKNDGQTAPQVSYLSRSDGYMTFFTPNEIVMDFRSDSPNTVGPRSMRQKSLAGEASNTVIRMQFIGANKHPTIVGQDELASKSNYFIGKDAKNWHKDVPNFAKINYQNLYPGIDMVFYGNHKKLEYDIRVAQGADPHKARFHIDGAKNVSIDKQGNLILAATKNETIMMHKPHIYQMIEGVKHTVSGKFVVFGKNEVGFNIGNYDKTKTLIIDPALLYSTYLGGSGGDNCGFAIAVDTNPAAPNSYITGYTNSTDFPVLGAAQSTNKGKGRTVFVTKLNTVTNTLVYSTYLGGSGGNDEGFGIAIDGVSSAYITGETNSTDFPTVNPFQATNNGAKFFSAFVAKLNPEGNALDYSTYLGGTGDNQEGNAIDVDSEGFAYVAGETDSFDFPTKNPFQATNNAKPRPAPYSPFTAYITKLNTRGNDLVFSTYLGGSGGQDEINGIAVDPFANDIYVTGETNSKDFPTKDPIQPLPKPAGDAQTGFIARMTPDGSGLVFSTYYGGSGGNDYPTSIAFSLANTTIYVAGYTNSSDFPVVNAAQPTNRGPNFNGFLVNMNRRGNTVLYSTYLGGSGGNDRINAVAVDSAGQAHVTGQTNSTDFPLANAIQTTNMGPDTTAFVSTFRSDGSLLNSTYLGGSGGNDKGFGIASDTLSSAYITGLTNSSDFPLKSPFQSTMTSSIMAFVTRLDI